MVVQQLEKKQFCERGEEKASSRLTVKVENVVKETHQECCKKQLFTEEFETQNALEGIIKMLPQDMLQKGFNQVLCFWHEVA